MATITSTISIRDRMSAGFRSAASSGQSLIDRLRGVRAETEQTTATTGALTGALRGFVSVLASAYTIKRLADFTKGCTEAMNRQIEAETKLTTVMSQRMGATQGEIDQIRALTAAQQGLGVIGDEVQMAGAQQLSTFLNTSDALKTLIPAMNNLAAQQNGVHATAENMVNIGNLMGKVMQGQTSALRRVGISFTEAQEEALKYGTEAERAAILAQVITDNVGNMNQALANTPEGRIQQISNEFGDMREELGARVSPALMYMFDVIQTNMPTIQALMDNFGTAAAFIITMTGNVIGAFLGAVGWIQANWSIIQPILAGVAFLFGVWAAKILVVRTALMLLHGVQLIYNAALAASPITWILIGITAVIAGIYALTAAYNKATGDSISATGILVGAISTAVAFVGNLGIGLVNGMISYGVTLYNFIADFANFFANVFNDPVTAIGNLFLGLFDYIVGIMKSAASVIDAVLGSDLAGATADWQAGVDSKVRSIIGENQNTAVQKLDAENYKLDRIDYGDAWNWGYNKGSELGQKAADAWQGFTRPDLSQYEYKAPALTGGTLTLDDDTAANISDTASNTKAIAKAVDVTGTQLKYLFDAANRDAINRYTTASIKVDMTNNNTISNDMDVDSIVSSLKSTLEDEMASVAEGVH